MEDQQTGAAQANATNSPGVSDPLAHMLPPSASIFPSPSYSSSGAAMSMVQLSPSVFLSPGDSVLVNGSTVHDVGLPETVVEPTHTPIDVIAGDQKYA